MAAHLAGQFQLIVKYGEGVRVIECHCSKKWIAVCDGPGDETFLDENGEIPKRYTLRDKEKSNWTYHGERQIPTMGDLCVVTMCSCGRPLDIIVSHKPDGLQILESWSGAGEIVEY